MTKQIPRLTVKALEQDDIGSDIGFWSYKVSVGDGKKEFAIVRDNSNRYSVGVGGVLIGSHLPHLEAAANCVNDWVTQLATEM